MESLDPKNLKEELASFRAAKKDGSVPGIEVNHFNLSEPQKREREIKRIQTMIHKRRWNRDPNIQMVFPEISLDLRPANINKIIGDAGFTPETDDSRDFMEEWDRIQAEKLYEYYSKKGGKREPVSIESIAAEPATEGVKKVDNDILPEEEKDPVKALALHTIAKIPKFEDLNANTEKEGNEKIIELARKIWNEFTVHGFPDFDPMTGEKKKEVARRTDLDGRGFLGILHRAGIKINMDEVNYVFQGESSPTGKGIVGDTSNEDGVVAKNFGELLIGDHHGGKSGRDTSATKNMYHALADFGIIEKSEALDNFADFVTKEDNKDYTDEECRKIMENFETSLFGLQRYLSGEQVIKVFEDFAKSGDKLDPYEKLPDEYLKTLHFALPSGREIDLENVVKKLSNVRDSADREVEKMEKSGFFIDNGDRYGKVLIDEGKMVGKARQKKLKGGIEIIVVRNAGFGGLVVWNPEAKSFSIQVTDKDIDFSLPEGFNYRGRYWLKNPNEKKLTVSLEMILGKLSGQENYQLDENLKKLLEAKEKSVRKELNEGQIELLESMKQKARIPEIEGKFPMDESKLSADEKKIWERRKKSLGRVRNYLEMIVRKFSAEDIKDFQEGIMNQFLDEYRRSKTEKDSKMKMNVEEIREFRKDILKRMGKALEKKFGKDSATIVNFYRNMFDVEYLLNNSK